MDIKRCNGKIYTIRSYETELIYVGSTAEKRLSARFSKHKSSYKYYLKSGKKYSTACEILKYSDAYIELVREVENCTKDELRKIEGQYTREIKCVNKNIAGRTQKEYYTNNKDKRNGQSKEYLIINKDKIKEQSSLKYICECGKKLIHSNKSRHDKVCKFNSKAI